LDVTCNNEWLFERNMVLCDQCNKYLSKFKNTHSFKSNDFFKFKDTQITFNDTQFV